jgi:F0F1-type ATP synthase assembly protein I
MSAAPTPENRYGRRDKQSPFFRKAGIMVAIAFELPGAILGGLLIGYLLDNYFNTSPWLMLVLPVLAFTGACVRLVRWSKLLARNNNQTDVPREPHSRG